jgi:hypothetical protein
MMSDFGTRALVLYVDAVDFTSAVKDVQIVSKKSDSNFVSYADALAGGARDYFLHMVLKQYNDAAGLWYYIWSELGDSQAIEIWPNGYNAGTPTADYPQFSGTAVVAEPDGTLVGGESNESPTNKQVVTVDWPFTAKPTLAIA